MVAGHHFNELASQAFPRRCLRQAVIEQLVDLWITQHRFVGQRHQAMPKVTDAGHVKRLPKCCRGTSAVKRRYHVHTVVGISLELPAQAMQSAATTEKQQSGTQFGHPGVPADLISVRDGNSSPDAQADGVCLWHGGSVRVVVDARKPPSWVGRFCNNFL
jgi:hypothetical protein